MFARASCIGLVSSLFFVMSPLHGAGVSRQQADSLARKITVIEQRGSDAARTPRQSLRTSMSETEVNSWFTYHAPPLLPKGVTQPKVTIVGNRRVIGAAIVDLDAVAKSRASGRPFDVWNLIGGRVPVTMTGLVHAERGQARFEMESAEISGIPVPRRIVEEMVGYYTRTPDHPNGIQLDDAFALPAGIQAIEISPGAAVVVQ
jgi:hypothetical protein